jgi:hypothetical protein
MNPRSKETARPEDAGSESRRSSGKLSESEGARMCFVIDLPQKQAGGCMLVAGAGERGRAKCINHSPQSMYLRDDLVLRERFDLQL